MNSNQSKHYWLFISTNNSKPVSQDPLPWPGTTCSETLAAISTTTPSWSGIGERVSAFHTFDQWDKAYQYLIWLFQRILPATHTGGAEKLSASNQVKFIWPKMLSIIRGGRKYNILHSCIQEVFYMALNLYKLRKNSQ